MDTPNMQNLYSVIEQMIEDNKERIEGIQNAVEGVAEEVHSMSKILTVGNGQPPLTVRMALVEKLASDALQQVADLRKSIVDEDVAKDGRKWQLFLVFGSCIVSLLTAILPHLFKH